MSTAGFQKLFRFLDQELAQHEKLLGLLTQERAAIVKLNQQQIETISEQKSKLLSEAKKIEIKRNEVIESLMAGDEAEGPKRRPKQYKLNAILAFCTSSALTTKIEKLAENLKRTVQTVQEMNHYNSQLMKQSLGLISSTLAIIRSAPGTELPTYDGAGVLHSSADPAFSRRSSGVVRQA